MVRPATPDPDHTGGGMQINTFSNPPPGGLLYEKIQTRSTIRQRGFSGE